MRLALADGRCFHLGYCFNVLPGETPEALIDQAARFCGPLRRALEVERLGVGLWIAADAARVLAADAGARRALRRALDDAGCYVFTLNGFPYGGFHAPRVKEGVFRPGWDDPARLAYTVALGAVLADLLPDEIERGTISTVPLGARDIDRGVCGDNLERAEDAFEDILAATGKRIVLCVEPEPGAALERVSDTAAFVADTEAESHVGLCFDTCHAAVVGEDPAAAWRAMAAAGVGCGKLQVSSALVVRDPRDDAQRAALEAMDEPRFLHQVRSDTGGTMDIPEALARLDRRAPWRVHFHVPVHAAAFGALKTTQATIAPALEAAFAAPGALPDVEVETYTWSVLPEDERPADDAGLVAGLAREMQWTLAVLAELGAKVAP